MKRKKSELPQDHNERIELSTEFLELLLKQQSDGLKPLAMMLADFYKTFEQTTDAPYETAEALTIAVMREVFASSTVATELKKQHNKVIKLYNDIKEQVDKFEKLIDNLGQ